MSVPAFPALIDSNASTYGPYATSADGRYAAFYTEASNLVSNDTNDAPDIVLHDNQTNLITRLSVGNGGAQANAESGPVFGMSGDGRYIVFSSPATNLSPLAVTGEWHIYLRDRVTDTTALVDQAAGVAGSYFSYDPKISLDGRYVVYFSYSDNLVAGDTNAEADTFRYDRLTGTTVRVSVATDGTQATGGDSARSGISADGNIVVFESSATNLVPGDTNNAVDIFAHDVTTQETVRVSRSAAGTQLPAGSLLWRDRVVSDSGRHVVFQTAGAAVPDDTNGVEVNRPVFRGGCLV